MASPSFERVKQEVRHHFWPTTVAGVLGAVLSLFALWGFVAEKAVAYGDQRYVKTSDMKQYLTEVDRKQYSIELKRCISRGWNGKYQPPDPRLSDDDKTFCAGIQQDYDELD